MCETLQVSKAVRQFLDWLSLRSRPRTVEFYRTFLERFTRHVDDIPLSSVKRLHVETFSARHHALTAACRFLRWCHEVAEMLPTNPARAVTVPKNGQRSRVLIRSERVLIRRHAERYLRRAILAMEQTACRPQEVRLLTWEMIFPKPGAAAIAGGMASGRHWFRLESFKSKERRSDQSKPRIIAIPPRLGKLLDRLRRAEPSPSGIIFKGPSGRAWTPNAFRCAFRRLRSKLAAGRKVDVSGLVPYLYRHTRATELARDGVNAHVLKEWMGHARVETTGRYTHFNEMDLGAIARRPWK